MDVIASIMDAYLRYDNPAFAGGLLVWVQRWNRAVAIHRSRIGVRHHHFVFLEDLVRQPQEEWRRLCGFLELPLDADIDPACHQYIADPAAEPWKRGALSGLPQAADSKTEQLFGPQLRDWLREKLSSYEELYAASSMAYDRDDSFLLPASALKRCVEGRPMAAEGRYRVA
jgi:hypothetical protein